MALAASGKDGSEAGEDAGVAAIGVGTVTLGGGCAVRPASSLSQPTRARPKRSAARVSAFRI